MPTKQNLYEIRLREEFKMMRRLQVDPGVKGVLHIFFTDRFSQNQLGIGQDPESQLYPEQYLVNVKMPVYTDEGDYYGDVEEAIIISNKLNAWRIKATKHSTLNKMLTGAKGATIPHQLVRSIGDIMIISSKAVPSGEELPGEEIEEF